MLSVFCKIKVINCLYVYNCFVVILGEYFVFLFSRKIIKFLILVEVEVVYIFIKRYIY